MAKTGVDLSTYRSSIGLWPLATGGGRQTFRRRRRTICFSSRHQSIFIIVVYFFLLLRASTIPVDGDVERNPGPQPSLPSSPATLNLNLNVNRQLDHSSANTSASSYGSRPRHGAATSVSVVHFNARSLLPKRSELQIFSSKWNPHIIAVSETWLTGEVRDGSYLPVGYVAAFRADRPGPSRGGGVLIMCREDVQFIQRSDLCHWGECAWIELPRFRSSRHLLLGCYYRPPTSTTSAVEEFINSLESTFAAVDLSSTDVMLVGEFNAISSSWCVSDTTNLPGRLLEPTFLSLGLDQCVSSRTHVDSNGHLTSLLNLVLMSDSGLLNAVETLPPVGN